MRQRKKQVVCVGLVSLVIACTLTSLCLMNWLSMHSTWFTSSVSSPVQDTQVTRATAFTLVATHAHDPTAFTEGLFFSKTHLYESTGSFGKSYLKKFTTPSTSHPSTLVLNYSMPSTYFGEGIALIQDRLYMLTYKAQLGFIFNSSTLDLIGNFTFQTETNEGWGMTTEGEHLIVSDGSEYLFIWDPPPALRIVKRVKVMHKGKALTQLNELEFWKDNFVLANVWFTNLIVVIDLRTGNVVKEVDCSELVGDVENLQHLTGNKLRNAVMNGIAIDPKTGHVFLTGKLWNKMFEIQLHD